MRINNQGFYEICRWSSTKGENKYHISTISPEVYFQKVMSTVRKNLLDGAVLKECDECHQVELHEKVSGRQRQLLKTGVLVNWFGNSLLSSPWIPEFQYSQDNNGDTELFPVDWQVDLGNFCNSVCLYCHPMFSSKIASEWKSIGLIDNLPENSWCDNQTLLDKFINTLINTPNLKYLHFIGGETLITPAFKKILLELVKNNITDVTVGFTTNLTTWDDNIIELLSKFENINVGLSIEALHPINDYVRYPSRISIVKEILDKWVNVSKHYNWLAQIRITPTVFTVMFLAEIYEYALVNNLAVESCNFLERPKELRPSKLNSELRSIVIEKLNNWISKQNEVAQTQIINTRNPESRSDQLIQDAKSYINYLQNMPYDDDASDLIKFIKIFESRRLNSVLDYLPEYEEFLRSAGY